MITKRHISEYLARLSSGISAKQGEMSDHVWHELHEYLIRHYKRLDKKARAYADEIFDQLDTAVTQRIDSLPEGREKKVLYRKLFMIRGERCPVPVLYLDTTVIENLIRHALGQPPSHSAAGDLEALYEEILALVGEGKLVYLEDAFHREALKMGGTLARDGLSIVRRFSEGLSFKHSQTIEDFQVLRALRGFIDGNGPVNYRSFWRDAFGEQTVHAIMKKHPSVAFENPLAITGGSTSGIEWQENPVFPYTRLRIRYDEAGLKKIRQLKQQSARHLRDLVRLGMKYYTIRGKAQQRYLDGFWAGQKMDRPLALWKHCGGKPEGPEGLMSLYESEHFRNIPAIRIKRDIWNALSVDGNGSEQVTGPPHINVLSSVLPYTDVMVLGRKMTEIVRNRLHLDDEFDTEIYSMDEYDSIITALRDVPGAD